MESEDRQTKLFLELWKWADEHKRLVFGILAALVVIILWVGFFFWHQGQKEASASEALSSGVTHSLTEELRVQSAEALVKVATEYPNTSAAERALLLAGAKYFTEGKYSEAQTQFDRFMREHPRSPFISQALFGIAVTADAQGKVNDAIAAYKGVVERHSTDNVAAQAKFALGRLYEGQGNLPLARDYYIQAEQTEFTTIATQASLRLKNLFEKHPDLIPGQPPAPTTAPILNLKQP